MLCIELCVVVLSPILIFVIVAQRISKEEEETRKSRRHAHYKGKFAEES